MLGEDGVAISRRPGVVSMVEGCRSMVDALVV